MPSSNANSAQNEAQEDSFNIWATKNPEAAGYWSSIEHISDNAFDVDDETLTVMHQVACKLACRWRKRTLMALEADIFESGEIVDYFQIANQIKRVNIVDV